MDVDDSYSLMRFLFRYKFEFYIISFVNKSFVILNIQSRSKERVTILKKILIVCILIVFYGPSILTNFKSAGKMTKFHLFSLFIFLRRCERGERLMLASHSTNHTFLYRFFNDLKVYAHAREILYQERSSLSKQITKNTHRIIIKFRFAQHYLKISLTTFLYAILVERELLE